MDPNQYDLHMKTRLQRIKQRVKGKKSIAYSNGEWSGWVHQIENERLYRLMNAVLFLLLSSSIFLGSTSLIFLFFAILAYMWGNFYYLTFVSKKLEIHIIEEQLKLFTEDDGMLRLRITHNSLLPIFFGKLRVGTDKNILFQHGEELIHMNQLHFNFQQVGRSQWEVELPFTAIKRGVAQLRLFDMEIDSFFGWGKAYLQTKDKMQFEVIVYPRSEKVAGLEKISPKKQGEQPSRSSLFEEKSRVLGTRDYVPGDPFGSIHWKATARMNSLQSKVYERTTLLSWLFVIDISSSSFEEKMRGIAFLLHYATKHNISFSILVNIKKLGNPSYIVMNSGEGKQQLYAGMMLLARIKVENVMIPSMTFGQILHQQAVRHPYVIACTEQAVMEKWDLPASTEGFVLENVGCGVKLVRLRKGKKHRKAFMKHA
ncbi:DUF58 domain-containing protein [Sutcliffiella horikoshii]|uniref:DUF58 domain-containing protein n=1 Tax=Sutcliffiella horikoshii TaxID=79883 RepID=A0AA94WNS9_9BACI|nr:DUF58 domain-containing protein [Sutcliffiella horikoshii]TYS57366.1 DUF58 domain-containing protein [Sutcliffiella horikoshii]